jgi:hypothetical protein
VVFITVVWRSSGISSARWLTRAALVAKRGSPLHSSRLRHTSAEPRVFEL